MSDTKNTGGPAFPRPMGHARLHNGENTAQDGMTLRDYFAGLAMPEMLRQYAEQANAKNQWDFDWMMGVSMNAYHMADAMLKAREQ